jgi:hypothetical protein
LFPPARARVINADGTVAEGDQKPKLRDMLHFPEPIVEIARDSLRNKSLGRADDASRRVARASARAAALYLRFHAPGELTGALGRDVTRLFQPSWSATDQAGLRALLHQLNDGAPRPLDRVSLCAVLASVGWA